MFLSGRYDAGGDTPDDVKPDICFAAQPRICTGILLFDILVANPDRHTGNLKVDDPIDPAKVEVIDHDRALLGSSRGQGEARLARLWDRLGTSGGSETGENENCLLAVANTSEYFEEWIARIDMIPDMHIDDICEDTLGIPATRSEVEAIKAFLKHRKRRLRDLIKNNKAEFPGIRQWGLLL